MNAAGITFLALGGAVAVLNLYLSFLRYPLHLAFGGTRATYRWVSGLPTLGSILLLFAIIALPYSRLTWLAAALLVLDTGGLVWFAATMWWSQRRRSAGA